MLLELLPFVFMMLVTGVVAGVIAGLLGVGGGIVIVPVLDTALSVYGVDPAIRMHVAVATSLACIVLTSIASAKAHHARQAIDLQVVKFWAPAIVVGAIVGSLIASQIDGTMLSIIFGIVAILAALKMASPYNDIILMDDVPKGIFTPIAPFLIGSLSSMMGIGGGTFTVPILTFMNKPIHQAVATAALFGLFISIPGTLGFVISGLADPRLPPGSIGYLNIIGFMLISPVSLCFAPLGVKLAHQMNKRQLSIVFGSFLLIVGCRMIYRAIA